MKMSKFLLLLVILPCFVQSLSVNRISDALSFNNIFVDHREFGFTPAPPPHTEEAKLARYVVHYSGNLVICILQPVRDIKKRKHQFTDSKCFKISFKAFKMKKQGLKYF